MIMVPTWTGNEASALRKALRMSVTDFAEHVGAARRTVVKWSTQGMQVKLRPDMQAAMDTVLGRASAEARERFEQLRTERTVADTEPAELDVLSSGGDVRRRAFLPLAVTAAAHLAAGPELIRLLDALIPPHGSVEAEPWTADELKQAVAAAKTNYQACHYERVIGLLAPLLAALCAAEAAASGDSLGRMRVLSADAYHVAGSVLLKLGDFPMALLAAERSVRYAHASGDPVASATSARIMTHALMRNRHTQRAIDLAASSAQALDRSSGLGTSDAVAAYGSLVLRGAIAAARAEDRDAAQTLLEEASRAAAKLGHDGNDRWTGFGPSNVLLHRVNVALALGDAGTAIHLARQVDLDQVKLAERRACLFVDVAQAYTQWGRYEPALSALRAADRIAPEEIRSRPAVHRIVSDLAVLARGSVRADVDTFAAAVGVTL